MLNEKTVAPNFILEDKDNKKISLSDFIGKKVILYFYPKDNTPGCTRQACAFSKFYKEFEKNNSVIIGISKDSVKSHKDFSLKFNLPFILLSDENKEVIQKYDVWKEKKLYGKTYMGVERTTYIIDENGFIEKIFKNVNPNKNPEEILNYLR